MTATNGGDKAVSSRSLVEEAGAILKEKDSLKVTKSFRRQTSPHGPVRGLSVECFLLNSLLEAL